MKARLPRFVSVPLFLLLFPVFCEAQTPSAAVTVPAGTTVAEVSYEDEGAGPIILKPAEQVALLFVYGIWNLETDCADKDMGVGRLRTLGDLVKGVKTEGGTVVGLTVNPARDTNYTYSLQLIGEDCVILAVPRLKGLGGFAVVGSPARFASVHFYYNPNGGDLAAARKLGSVGYSGSGFKR